LKYEFKTGGIQYINGMQMNKLAKIIKKKIKNHINHGIGKMRPEQVNKWPSSLTGR
jgi:hypothetical protein